MEEQRRIRNFDTGEHSYINSVDYGSGFFDTLTKIGSKLTGKTASKLASKAAEKLIEKGAEKVGEKTGEVLGEKIYDKFSSKRKKESPPIDEKESPPIDENKGLEIIKFLQEEKRKKEDKKLNDYIVAEFL